MCEDFRLEVWLGGLCLILGGLVVVVISLLAGIDHVIHEVSVFWATMWGIGSSIGIAVGTDYVAHGMGVMRTSYGN